MAGLLAEASPDDLALLAAATSTERSTELDNSLWGRSPARTEATAGAVANLRKQFESRRELEATSVSRDEAATLLGTTPQSVTDCLESGRMVGFKRGRRWLIPAWQFDADAERGILDGLGELVQVFPGGTVTLSRWVVKPSADFGGATPRDLLAKGELMAVLDVAGSLTAAGW
jgi:hypothetical protein